mmetsp:Transcript_28632/g.69816  ORF Transcript_28632/g.69816 Transcript_28632/m.69816 type:complete len:340 (-) Transcript_28632:182-1201(-)
MAAPGRSGLPLSLLRRLLLLLPVLVPALHFLAAGEAGGVGMMVGAGDGNGHPPTPSLANRQPRQHQEPPSRFSVTNQRSFHAFLRRYGLVFLETVLREYGCESIDDLRLLRELDGRSIGITTAQMKKLLRARNDFLKKRTRVDANILADRLSNFGFRSPKDGSPVPVPRNSTYPENPKNSTNYGSKERFGNPMRTHAKHISSRRNQDRIRRRHFRYKGENKIETHLGEYSFTGRGNFKLGNDGRGRDKWRGAKWGTRKTMRDSRIFSKTEFNRTEFRPRVRGTRPKKGFPRYRTSHYDSSAPDTHRAAWGSGPITSNAFIFGKNPPQRRSVGRNFEKID